MPRVSPQEISKKYKRQSLGMPKASPSSSIKIPGFFQTLHFYCFMHSCVVLGASSFSFSFWFFVCFCLLSFLNKLVGPPLSYIGLQIVWFGLEKSRKVHAYVVKRARFWLWPMLCHAMLDIVLALCLVFFAVAWLVINNWDCLMCLGWIMRCFSILKHSIVVFSFDALFGLTWRMLTPCYDYLKSP